MGYFDDYTIISCTCAQSWHPFQALWDIGSPKTWQQQSLTQPVENEMSPLACICTWSKLLVAQMIVRHYFQVLLLRSLPISPRLSLKVQQSI